MITVPPEYLMPQDSHATQDCELAAGKRWLTKHPPQSVTLLGDDPYSNQPLCVLAAQEGHNFMYQPNSQATFYEHVAFW